ncbi:MAG: ABC transporter ATP-binding protein [Bacillota bacterium]
MIRLEGVVKTYETGKISLTALKGINLNVQKGEFTSIMGPSGCGKSTLMNVLGCLDKMTAGKYLLNGQDVSDLTDDELAMIRNKEIGFVFQSFNLLPRLSVLENVELPMIYAGVPLRQRRKQALDALDNVNLLNWIKHKPNEISGGQKQRVAIARAIANRPSVILADEPTGNLDTQVTLEIMEILQQLNQGGATILVVTHEPEVAKYTKRVVKLKDGLIISDNLFDPRAVL